MEYGHDCCLNNLLMSPKNFNLIPRAISGQRMTFVYPYMTFVYLYSDLVLRSQRMICNNITMVIKFGKVLFTEYIYWSYVALIWVLHVRRRLPA